MPVSEMLLDKAQTEKVMRGMSLDGKAPGRGRPVTVTHPDGGTSTFSASVDKGSDGQRMWLLRQNIIPSGRPISWPDRPTFQGVSRCTVRDEPGMAFRTPDLDHKGMAVFVADRRRRAFDRNQWGSTQVHAFSFLNNVTPATADDIASRDRFLARTEAGPDVPPELDGDMVQAFALYLGESGEELDHHSLAEAIRHGLVTDDCAGLVSTWAEGTPHRELAATFLALPPARRRELSDAVVAIGSGLRP